MDVRKSGTLFYRFFIFFFLQIITLGRIAVRSMAKSQARAPLTERN
jgi:hypothetical protein